MLGESGEKYGSVVIYDPHSIDALYAQYLNYNKTQLLVPEGRHHLLAPHQLNHCEQRYVIILSHYANVLLLKSIPCRYYLVAKDEQSAKRLHHLYDVESDCFIINKSLDVMYYYFPVDISSREWNLLFHLERYMQEIAPTEIGKRIHDYLKSLSQDTLDQALAQLLNGTLTFLDFMQSSIAVKTLSFDDFYANSFSFQWEGRTVRMVSELPVPDPHFYRFCLQEDKQAQLVITYSLRYPHCILRLYPRDQMSSQADRDLLDGQTKLIRKDRWFWLERKLAWESGLALLQEPLARRRRRRWC